MCHTALFSITQALRDFITFPRCGRAARHKIAESEWTDPIWKEINHDGLSRRLYEIFTQLGSISTGTDADANVYKLDLVEETKNV